MKRYVLLLTLTALIVLAASYCTHPILAAADEIIYMVGARNVLERGTLDTNFYLSYSVLAQGIPHRDVHMPGYILCLSAFVAALGPTHGAAVALNVLLYAAMILLVYALAEEILKDEKQAFWVAALTTILPPFPGYLFVAFPEFILTVLLLAAVLVSLKSRAGCGAAISGVLFGMGPLFRENLLLSLPIHFAVLPRRHFWRAFLPAALGTLALVYAGFSQNRAILPNNVFPGMLLASLESETPAASLWSSLSHNVTRNLGLVLKARPFGNVEDTALLVLLVLGMGALASVRHSGRVRQLGAAAVFSFGLVGAAVFLVYAVRATGRPWAGVRQFMAWEPLLLILSVPGLFRFMAWGVIAFRATGPHPRRIELKAAPTPPGLRAAGLGDRSKTLVVAAVALLSVAIDVAHIRFVNRWKEDELEDGRRFEAFVSTDTDAHRPKRLVVRSTYPFLYGLSHYPVEIVWPLRSKDELLALEKAIDFDFLVLAAGPVLPDVPPSDNTRYELIHADARTKWSIWRRRF